MTVRIREQIVQMNRQFQQTNALFHNFAAHFGLSDSAVLVLYSLYAAEQPCSQNDLCGDLLLSKQTVNSAVSSLSRQGYVRLEMIPGTRNRKSVLFTERGRKFAEKTVRLFMQAERSALASLSAKERDTFLDLSGKQFDSLREKIDRLMENDQAENA